MNDNKSNLKSINLGSLGSITVSQLNPESTDIYAKYPSTATDLCGNGIDYRGLGGANLDDDSACPAMS